VNPAPGVAEPAVRCWRWLGSVPVLLLASRAVPSADFQSSIDSRGPQAGQIESLWWIYFWITFVIYLLVLAFLVMAVARRRREKKADDFAAEGAPQLHMPMGSQRRTTLVISIATGATLVTLLVLLFADFFTGRKLYALAKDPDPIKIKVIGKQWWWEFRYEDELTSNVFTTANELHIPVGRTVHLDLTSQDVIHSFWIPNLAGKKDMIPGQQAAIRLRADEAGEYRGQCAEFCGHQHAHMRFVVLAEAPETFGTWLAESRKSAKEPETPSQKRGRDVFLGSSCVMCHTIAGTAARATVGPNLTHIASRKMIAAGALENNRGNLSGWILDPQHIKPGTRMPQNNINPPDLQALLDYLQSLK